MKIRFKLQSEVEFEWSVDQARVRRAICACRFSYHTGVHTHTQTHTQSGNHPRRVNSLDLYIRLSTLDIFLLLSSAINTPTACFLLGHKIYGNWAPYTFLFTIYGTILFNTLFSYLRLIEPPHRQYIGIYIFGIFNQLTSSLLLI